MIKNSIKVITFFFFFALVSCVTNKKVTYLQYAKYDEMASDTINSVTPADYKVLPYDNLFIKVVTPDPKLSEMFNTLPTTTSGISTSEQSADLISFSVDGEGYIQIPYAGRIAVGGKTLPVITAEVQAEINNYLADAAVTVKMVNNYVSLLGEVKRPGRYPIYKERLNIFQALAMGGDLDVYSNRRVVQVIRPTAHGNVVQEFSLTDRSILSSEFFFVMPNDVIYAKPMKGKFFQMAAFPYQVLLSTITTFILVWNVVRLK